MEDKNLVFTSILQEFVYVRTYSRWLEDKQRRETWEETVSRYCNYMKNKHGDKITDKELKDAYNAIYNMEVMPSMRAMWSAGKAADSENFALYNCAFVAIENIKDFADILYILLCFHPDTLVKTKNGDKKISDITIRDEVLSYDKDADTFCYIKPEKIIKNSSKDVKKLKLTFADGSVVKCTADHEFYTKNRGWVMAKDLTDTDDIQEYGG